MMQGVYIFVIFVCKRNVICTILGKKITITRTNKGTTSGTTKGMALLPLTNNRRIQISTLKPSMADSTNISNMSGTELN